MSRQTAFGGVGNEHDTRLFDVSSYRKLAVQLEFYRRLIRWNVGLEQGRAPRLLPNMAVFSPNRYRCRPLRWSLRLGRRRRPINRSADCTACSTTACPTAGVVCCWTGGCKSRITTIGFSLPWTGSLILVAKEWARLGMCRTKEIRESERRQGYRPRLARCSGMRRQAELDEADIDRLQEIQGGSAGTRPKS